MRQNVFFEDQQQQNINFAKKIQNVPFKAIILERKNRDRNVCYSTSNKHSFSFGITPRIRIYPLLRYRTGTGGTVLRIRILFPEGTE